MIAMFSYFFRRINSSHLFRSFNGNFVNRSTKVYASLSMSHSQKTICFNKLKNERSPYLLQHATNPVNWYSWTDEAIKKATNENKMIFLSVGYSTCHWCHVMEKESFENFDVAAIMNEHFVNIKVDREERPDIDKTYMTFVQMTSGGHGGWPMSVFLTPDLYPVFGGTYYPPEDKWGRPGFKTILLKIAEQWKSDPENLRRTGNKVIDTLRQISVFDLGIVTKLTCGIVPDVECTHDAIQSLSRGYDKTFGGFGFAPKFPQSSIFNLLFTYHIRNREEELGKLALDMALKTLEMMSKGGIYDHIGQGFSRYSTDSKWHIPHFEKMLYDQGQLAVVYAIAYQITKRSLFSEILSGILQYVDRDLSHDLGGFYSAEDADSFPETNASEKKEGAFYVWKNEEIESLLSRPINNKKDVLLSDLFKYHYNIQKNGNVDAENDPHGELLDENVLIILGNEQNTSEHFGISVEELRNELQVAKRILFIERNKRPRPHLDTKINTDWNGLMLSGFAKATQVLPNSNIYKVRAVKAAEFIRNHLWLESSQELLHCCYVDDSRKNIVQTNHPIQGFLNDYAFLIRGLLDLYEATFDDKWLEWSDTLQTVQNRLFWDDSGKTYNMAWAEDHSKLFNLKEDHDASEPSGNSISVANLLRLGSYLQCDKYNKRAEEILSAFTHRLTKSPGSLPEMLCGLMFYYDSATQVFIVDNSDSKNTQMILDTINENCIPNRVLAVLKPDIANSYICQQNSMAQNLIETNRGKKSSAAYICKKGTCYAPIDNVEELKILLNK